LVATGFQSDITAKYSAQLYPAAATVYVEKARKMGHEFSIADAFEMMGFKMVGSAAQEGAGRTNMDQVGTPEFTRWFGESKAVDVNGDPKVFYHGTSDDIEACDLNKTQERDPGFLGEGVYITGVRSVGDFYAESSQRIKGGAANTMPLYTNVKNTKVYNLSDRVALYDEMIADPDYAKKQTEKLKAEGYDSASVVDASGAVIEMVVFDPTQLKSVYNKGTYDPNDPMLLNQTDSDAFREWFGDSVVVDENGDPLVVYHGGLGANDIEVFSSDYAGDTTGNNITGAFHFTNDPVVAEDYGRQAFIRRYQYDPASLVDDGYINQEILDEWEENDSVYDEVEKLAEGNIGRQDVYLAIENPIIIDVKGQRVDVQEIEDLTRYARTGHDPDGKYFDEYYSQQVGSYSEEDIEDNRKEIESLAREEYGLEENESIEDYQFADALYQHMSELGYEPEGTPIDGIIIKNMIDDIGEASNKVADQYIVFDSTRIKSVDNIGTYGINDPRIMYQSQPMFYNALELLTDAKLPGKGSGASYAELFNRWAKKGLIKQEELEWSGVIEWLNDQKGKLIKQDVVEFLQANQIQVQDVMLGAGDYTWEGNNLLDSLNRPVGQILNLDEGFVWQDNEGNEAALKDSISISEAVKEVERLLDVKIATAAKKTKFEKYVLPGGKDYRELLLTLSEKEAESLDLKVGLEIQKGSDGKWRLWDERVNDFVFFDAYKTRSELENKISGDSMLVNKVSRDTYVGGHYRESNVLASCPIQ